MMRASRPATAPIIPDTAVSMNTGATASWMPCVTAAVSRGNAMAAIIGHGRAGRGSAALAFPAALLHHPMPIALHPALGHPAMATALADPVAAHPLVAAVPPFPMAGRPHKPAA